MTGRESAARRVASATSERVVGKEARRGVMESLVCLGGCSACGGCAGALLGKGTGGANGLWMTREGTKTCSGGSVLLSEICRGVLRPTTRMGGGAPSGAG